MLPIQLWPQQKAIAISHLKPEKCVSPQASACFDLGVHLPEGWDGNGFGVALVILSCQLREGLKWERLDLSMSPTIEIKA